MAKPKTSIHDVAKARLAEAGKRYTAQARTLVEVVSAGQHPLTITEIQAAAPGLAQSSIYRNLASLQEAGVLRRIATEDDRSLWELNEEHTSHHHHLICSRCGKVRDLDLPETLETQLQSAIDRLARDAGFVDVSHRLDLIGLCAECA